MAKHTPAECRARKYTRNPDGALACDLEEGHLGPHWDPEYGEHFTTPDTDPA